MSIVAMAGEKSATYIQIVRGSESFAPKLRMLAVSDFIALVYWERIPTQV